MRRPLVAAPLAEPGPSSHSSHPRLSPAALSSACSRWLPICKNIDKLAVRIDLFPAKLRYMKLGDDLLQRITVSPEVFGGKPMIRGTRITVEQVLSMLADGNSTDAALREYPTLEPEDIQACITYANRVVVGKALTEPASMDALEEDAGEEPSQIDPQYPLREGLKPKAAKIWLMTVLVALWTADRLIDLMVLLQSGQRRTAPTRRVVWPKGLKEQLMRRQRNICAYCGRRYTSHYFDIDHMDPVAYGGSNDISNLQVLCGPCNRRKGDQNDREFRSRYSGLVPGRRLTPPSRPVSQSEFDAATRRTGASVTVQQRRRNRFLTPREKITTGSIVCGIIAFFGAYLGLDGIGVGESLASIPAAVFGVAIGGGIWLRARVTGALYS